jgi:hypothetical protein
MQEYAFRAFECYLLSKRLSDPQLWLWEQESIGLRIEQSVNCSRFREFRGYVQSAPESVTCGEIRNLIGRFQ